MMDKKQFDFKDEAFKEKLKNCKSREELEAFLKAAGVEFTDEELDAVSGGLCWPDCPSYYPGPDMANDLSGLASPPTQYTLLI